MKIKHVETGKYLHLEDINTPDVTLDDFDGSTNQQFKLMHDNVSGAFEISSIIYPNQKIIVETSNYTLQHSSTNPEPFKIIYDGYEHYRIAPKTNEGSINNQSYNYTKYLKKASSSDSISCPSSNPTDSNILWDFIEVIVHEDSSTTYVSKSNKKVLSYSPTALSNHPLYIVTSHDINVDVFDCALGSSSNYTQNTIDQYTFINGNQYLISISFQNSYYEGYIICYNNSNIVDYYDELEVSLPARGSQLIYFAPATNEYIIEISSQDVVMQIYEQSATEVCMIYNSEESQEVYTQTLHQFDINCFYYILLFNPDEVSGATVDLSIAYISDEFIVPSHKNIELISSETKIYKIDLSETEMMTLYTTDRNVTLELFELVNNNLIPLCDNEDDLLVPLTEEIEENKLYYLYITASTSQTNELFISYNASFAVTDLTVTENDENDVPKVYREVISTYGETKFYQFTPITSGLYYFRTKAQQNGNTYMELYDSEGTLLSVDDNSGETWSAKINYYLVAEEDYYFSVRYKYYYSSGQYDLQIYNEDTCIWKINWQQIAKSYASMGDFTIITEFYIWSIGIIEIVDINTRTVTFSSMTWSYSIVTQEPYLYQTIGMIIGSSYLGEYIDPITGYTSYSYLLVEGGGELDTYAVIPNTWYYECTYYDISIEFSVEELEYYLDQGIIRFEPIESV